MITFCLTQRSRNITRSTPHFSNHDFLLARAWRDIGERILTIKRSFAHPLILSDRGAQDTIDMLTSSGKITPDITLCGPDINGILPVPPGTFDLVISVFDAHIANDLPAFLFQLHAALAPGGACFIALPGGETLADLRHSLTAAEIEITGGAHPRVHPFVDRATLAALMQGAGFALPVVDVDTVTIDYASARRALDDLRGMGEGNILTARSRRFAPRGLFKLAEEKYRARTIPDAPQGRDTPCASHPANTAHPPLPVRVDILHAAGWRET